MEPSVCKSGGAGTGLGALSLKKLELGKVLAEECLEQVLEQLPHNTGREGLNTN